MREEAADELHDARAPKDRDRALGGHPYCADGRQEVLDDRLRRFAGSQPPQAVSQLGTGAVEHGERGFVLVLWFLTVARHNVICLCLIGREHELGQLHVKLGFQPCGVLGCRNHLRLGLLVILALAFVGLADLVEKAIGKSLSDRSKLHGELLECEPHHFAQQEARKLLERQQQRRQRELADNFDCALRELCRSRNDFAHLSDETTQKLLGRRGRRFAARGNLVYDALDLLFGQRFGLIAFEPFEEVVQHRFGPGGERLEMVVEKTFGREVARLSVTIIAGELFPVDVERFIGELFQCFPKLAVFKLRSKLGEGCHLGRSGLSLSRFG